MAPPFPIGPIRRGGFSLRLELPAPWVVVSRASGHADTEMMAILVDGIGEAQRAWGGRIDVFHDWLELTRYTVDARSFLVSSAARNASILGAMHILHSAAFETDLAVANLTLGGAIVSHTDRASFEAALDAAVRSERDKRR